MENELRSATNKDRDKEVAFYSAVVQAWIEKRMQFVVVGMGRAFFLW